MKQVTHQIVVVETNQSICGSIPIGTRIANVINWVDCVYLSHHSCFRFIFIFTHLNTNCLSSSYMYIFLF
ncbi:hypothetical protein BLOT_016221 [Blomia tropicalis]|nr:hypothetical protein BLOT_016221 [Blomia tropicalis]